jgi:hypothetical protein
MVKSIAQATKKPTITEAKDDMRELIGLLSSLSNVILSMIAVFVAVFYIGDTVTRDIGMVRCNTTLQHNTTTPKVYRSLHATY